MKRTAPFLLILILAGCPKEPGGPAAPAESRFAAVEVLLKKKDFTGAIQALENMREAQGTDAELAINLADLYKLQGDPARGIVRLREAIEKNPGEKTAYLSLASLYIQVKEFASARQTLEKARALGADDVQVSVSMGSCLASLQDLDGAMVEFERAGAAAAKNRAALESEGTLTPAKQRELTRAREMERAVLQNEALVFIEKQDFSRARELLEKCLAQNPNWAPAKRELARVFLAQETQGQAKGQPLDKKAVDKAMDLLWSIKDELKDDWRVAEAMGDGWLLEGDLEAALAAYTDALRFGQNPPSVEARYRTVKQMQIDAAKKAGKSPPAPGKPPGGEPK